jgi:beta-phosphoglucomutase
LKNIFKGKTAVIFDFDGTIADSFKIHETAFQQALETYQLRFSYADYLGMSTAEAIAGIFTNNSRPIDNETLSELVKRKRTFANQSYTTNLRAFPGAVELIQKLHGHGLILFIGSSGSRMNIGAGVEALGIGKYFSGIVTADDVSKSKPDPEIFITILQQHDINAADSIVIEDAESGIIAATAAGIDVVCVNPELSCHPQTGRDLDCLGFEELINEFDSFVQYEKSLSGHRNL